MSQIRITMTAFSNITYNYEVELDITPEEWAEMSREEHMEVYEEVIWEDIEIAATDAETGEYLD